MNMLTAISQGNFEIRICATEQVMSPTRQEQLDAHLMKLMDQYGQQWKR